MKREEEIIETEMEKSMVDYTIASATETAIMDVYPYSAEVQNTKEQSA